MRGRTEARERGFGQILAVLVMLALGCGRVDWSIDPLETEPNGPEPDCVDDDECPEGWSCEEGTCVDPGPPDDVPWTDPFEYYPWDTDYFAETVQPMLQADGCINCHVVNYAYPPRLHFNAEPGSPEFWHNFDQIIALVDLEQPAAYARLVYIPNQTESHVGTAWHHSRQGETAYADVVAWIEDAQAVQDCYEYRYDDVVENGPSLWSSPCSPAPSWPCWPLEECPDEDEPPPDEEGDEEDEEEENGENGNGEEE